MTKQEIDKVNSLAVRDDLEAAAVEFLGYESAVGHEATVGGIVSEVDQWNKADDETRDGIDSYKAAKGGSVDDEKPKAKAKPKAKTK